MTSGSTGGPASGSGRRWRRLTILSLALIGFGAVEALGVGVFYEVQRVRLKDWASRNGDPDMVEYPPSDSQPCPNRMQAPTCLVAAAAASNVSDSDRDAVLDLLVIRKSSGSAETPAQTGQPETTSNLESFESVKAPEAP